MDEKHTTITRRDFVRGSVAVALGASVPVKAWEQGSGRSSTVVLVRSEKALGAANQVNVQVLRQILGQTVLQVTGTKSEREAWRSLANPEEIVGLVPTSHLNPTHRELIEAVHAALIEAGIPQNHIRMATGGRTMQERAPR